MNHVKDIIDFENGDMEEENVPAFFQRLYDNGTLFHLQGFYQRTFVDLLSAGLVTDNRKVFSNV